MQKLHFNWKFSAGHIAVIDSKGNVCQCTSATAPIGRAKKGMVDRPPARGITCARPFGGWPGEAPRPPNIIF